MGKRKRARILKKTNGVCAYCGVSLNDQAWHIEHVVSKSNGGSDDIDNLLPSCKRCNGAKRHRNPEQFRSRIISRSIEELDNINNRTSPFDMQSGSTHTTKEILNKISDLKEALSGCTIEFLVDDD